MNDPHEFKGPAPLTAALLARKGRAVPAGFTPRAIDGGARGNAPGPAAPRGPRPAGSVPTPGDQSTLQGGDANGPGPEAPGKRARVTLRLDETRHLRLKLAAAHTQQSLQEILTAALDRYLEDVAPEMLRGDCICLAPARALAPGDGR